MALTAVASPARQNLHDGFDAPLLLPACRRSNLAPNFLHALDDPSIPVQRELAKLLQAEVLSGKLAGFHGTKCDGRPGGSADQHVDRSGLCRRRKLSVGRDDRTGDLRILAM